MKSRTFTWVLAFFLGAAVMAPFSIPFIRPALAEVFTPQQLSERTLKLDDRIAAVERQLARVGTNNDPLGGSITQLQEQVNALQGQVKGLQSARDQARTDLGSLNKEIADQKTALGALKALQDNLVALQSAVGSLKTSFNKHGHYVTTTSLTHIPAIECKVLNGGCTWLGGGEAVATPGTFYTDAPRDPAP
jgi:peptidoglycan hydrolase CwlO-like protein